MRSQNAGKFSTVVIATILSLGGSSFAFAQNAEVVGLPNSPVVMNAQSCVKEDSEKPNGDSCDSRLLLLGSLIDQPCPSDCAAQALLNGTCSGGDTQYDIKVLSAGSSTQVPTFEDAGVLPGKRLDLDAVYSCYRLKDCRCEKDDSGNRVCVTKPDYTVYELQKYSIIDVDCPDVQVDPVVQEESIFP